MKLYILRHGEAADRPLDGSTDDSQRPLTAWGENQLKQLVLSCGDRLLDVNQVVSSPYLRARQTAAIIMRLLKGQSQWHDQHELLISPTITPGGTLAETGVFVESLESKECLLVSHLPLVEHLIVFLTDNELPRPMGTANLVALEVNAFVRGGAELLWSEQPDC